MSSSTWLKGQKLQTNYLYLWNENQFIVFDIKTQEKEKVITSGEFRKITFITELF